VGPAKEQRARKRFALLSVSSGFFTGILAGLVGLGGAEERVPFILYLLRASLNDMIVANLIISLATSSVNFALRAGAGIFTSSSLTVGGAMIVGSLAGAYVGSSLSHRVSERRLKAVLAFVLSLVLARLALDLAGGFGFSFEPIQQAFEIPTAGIFGLLIGVISGAVGVAGGEYRIPVLVFLFGFGIKVAGTTSQLISVPTILVALYRHRAMGFVKAQSLRIALGMGTGSVFGAVIGTLILLSSGEKVVEVVFFLLLFYTVSRLVLDLRTRTVERRFA